MSINKIRQIVRLKQAMQRWRRSTTRRHITTGHLPLDVGPDRKRFIVPTRFINLPIFISLLNEARDEFGYRPDGVLTLPTCDADLFQLILAAAAPGGDGLRPLLRKCRAAGNYVFFRPLAIIIFVFFTKNMGEVAEVPEFVLKKQKKRCSHSIQVTAKVDINPQEEREYFWVG